MSTKCFAATVIWLSLASACNCIVHRRAERVSHCGMRKPSYIAARCLTHTPGQVLVINQSLDSGGKSRTIALAYYESIAFVLDQTARRGADRVGCNNRHSRVHCLD